MKANAKSAKAARYRKEWLYDCLLLNVKSTSVYTFLHENEFLPLPNPPHSLAAVPERERRGVLKFDEMSVRKSLHVRESDMALLGKVNFAEHTRPGDNEKDADHVLVFLFRPFLGGLAVTCDNSTSNRSALRSLGIHGDRKNPQTSFQHPCDPSREIYTVIDPPHIFKCIRNNLQKVGKFLLFSESTAAALEFYSRQDVCKELHDSKATVAFTRRMNGLFDCLNSRRPEHVQYKEAEHIATLKENVTWLNNCCDYIESLPKQRQACFLTKPTSAALRVTLLSTIALVENLLASGFRYVLVGNFGQDPLEAHFEENNYEQHRADGWKKLKPNAVPTLFTFKQLRAFALTLHYYSVAAYEYVRSKFNNALPSQPKSQDKPLIAALMMDDMAIKKHVQLVGKKVVGYIDLGTGISDAATLWRKGFVPYRFNVRT
ncbi:hypothetical protein MRX96_031286 [Rhipicephalus microplus]